MVAYEWNEDLCRKYADGLRPMTRFDHRRWAQRIAGELVGIHTGASLVDLATGPGFLLVEIGRLVPGLDLIAHDKAEPMLAIAREEASAAGLEVRTVCCPAESVTLADGEADVITCKQLLHEVEEPGEVVAEAFRVLKPGGRLFLVDFDADGSRMAAFAIRMLLAVTHGREMADNMWKSFRAGLPGADVRAMALDAGFAAADYQRSGCNYLVTAIKEKP
jgi:ubiquinone/menaquinone biosynthesis C-methylase UbiE